jgi:hypothetical protein
MPGFRTACAGHLLCSDQQGRLLGAFTAAESRSGCLSYHTKPFFSYGVNLTGWCLHGALSLTELSRLAHTLAAELLQGAGRAATQLLAAR